MHQFRYDALPGRVVFGAGVARTELVGELDRLDAKRIMVVTTRSGEALARELTWAFPERLVAVFDGAETHIRPHVATSARGLAEASRADALLSVGGGSATGTAKVVALTSGLPIVAVPTTYAGSEVTSMWGLTEGSRKRTGTDQSVLPRSVVYDPELTLTLPADISAASGLNAMAHSVEAFWAPGRNPVSSLAAEESIRALAEGLPGVVEDPSDLVARSAALYGAYLAGAAFAVTGSGLHHKICHVLGGAFTLPHAQTHAIMLPYVLAYNAPAVPEATRRIGRALGGDDAVALLLALGTRLPPVGCLRDLGLREEQVDEAVAIVISAVPPDNPRPVDRDALRRIIHAAWAGTSAAQLG